MPQQEKKRTRAEYEARERLLKDRLAIALMLLKQRHGNDWSPWFGEGMWEDSDGLGEILRQSSEYEQAVAVVDLFVHRSER
jgi:hypothetical protein